MRSWLLSLNLYTVVVLMYAAGLATFVYSRKHVMNMLLSLEYIAISVFLLLVMTTLKLGMDIYLALFFLTLVVCEGSMGLGLLVCVARSHGGDLVRTLKSLKNRL